jgi:enoyl-[acyl-carrier protein] reductase III
VTRSGVAFITGGTRGIGRAVAMKLAERTGTLILGYVDNDSAASSTQAEITNLQCECLLVKANLAVPAEVDALIGQIRDRFSHLDIFVHCAALGSFKPTIDTKANQWDLTMNVSARSFLLCLQQLAPMMNGGTAVAVSSLGSTRVTPRYSAMGPAKAALESLVRYLASELAPRGVRVNAVTAGLVGGTTAANHMTGVFEHVLSRTPAGRLASPDDIADVIVFLTEPSSRWILGQSIVADGGYSLY